MGADWAKDKGPQPFKGPIPKYIHYPPISSLEIGPLSKFQPGAPSNLNLHKWHKKDDLQTLDKKCVLLLLVPNSQDEPIPMCSEARLYKLACNNLITTLFNEYKHYFNRISLVDVVVDILQYRK